jgi:DNA-binding transcriptional regulator GbsR (MarR family)
MFNIPFRSLSKRYRVECSALIRLRIRGSKSLSQLDSSLNILKLENMTMTTAPAPGPNEALLATHEQEQLANYIGDFIHYWGFKRIHGQIWTHIYLSQKPLCALDLIKRLKVSKASISLSLRDLLNYEVIQEHEKDSRGFETFIANPNIMEVITNILRVREKKMLAEIQMAFSLLNDLEPEQKAKYQIDTKRLELMGKMTNIAQKSLNSMIGMGEISMKAWAAIPFK